MSAEEVNRSLERLEQEQRDRYKPKPQEPATPTEAFATRLAAARSESISVDARWLR